MSLSNDYEIDILDHVLGTATLTPPSNIYIALSTADPGEDGSGIAEPSGGSYARVQHNTWNAASGRAITNDGVITFPQATGAWGDITHYAVFTAITGGTLIGSGALSETKSVVSGNTPRIADEGLTISVNSGGFSTFLSNEMLDHIFGNGAYSSPTIYVGLSTANPTDDGSGIAEPAGGSYARVAHSSWDAAASGASENTGTITFTEPTDSWGTITHAFLSDASTSGNMLLYGTLGTSQSVGTGDPVSFADGGLDITLT